MYKTIIAFFLVAMVMGIAGDAFCASRFEQGFRGVAWGTPKEKLPDLGLSEKALKNIYKAGPSAIVFMEGQGNLDLHFDDVPLLSIFMRFNDMVFYGFDMVFKAEHAARVSAVIAKEMQSPGEKIDDGLRWSVGGLVLVVTDRELLVTKE